MQSKLDEISVYKRILSTYKKIDEIQDTYDKLEDILRYSLKALIQETECQVIFIYFINLFERERIIAIDKSGIILQDFNEVITSLVEQVRKTKSSFVPDNKIFGGNYFVCPMHIKNKFIGALGISDSNNEISEADTMLVEEMGNAFDTIITQKNKLALLEDQRVLSREIDSIIDDHLNGQPGCEKAILQKIIDASNSACGYIFEGEEISMFNIHSTNELGDIIWKEYPGIVLAIKKMIQECISTKQARTTSYDNDENIMIANKYIRTIAGFPLMTKDGSSAGTLVLLSYNEISEGHNVLIEAASNLLDTCIIKDKNTEIMVKRFKKYVGKENINLLLNNPEWLNARKERIVVFSADLVGSTAYASKEPNALKTFNLVNKYLTMIAKTVLNDYKGTLDKYIGDEVMALFGAPIKDKNAPYVAAECALSVREKIKRMNEDARKKGVHTFDVKITMGLADVIIGQVGSEDTDTAYTAIGNDVNKLFKIAFYTTPNEIVINKPLKELLENKYYVEYVKDLELKGLSEPEPVYRLNRKSN